MVHFNSLLSNRGRWSWCRAAPTVERMLGAVGKSDGTFSAARTARRAAHARRARIHSCPFLPLRKCRSSDMHPHFELPTIVQRFCLTDFIFAMARPPQHGIDRIQTCSLCSTGDFLNREILIVGDVLNHSFGWLPVGFISGYGADLTGSTESPDGRSDHNSRPKCWTSVRARASEKLRTQ